MNSNSHHSQSCTFRFFMWRVWSYCSFIFYSLLIRSGDGFIPSRCTQTHAYTELTNNISTWMGEQCFYKHPIHTNCVTEAETVWVAWSHFFLPANHSQRLIVDFTQTHKKSLWKLLYSSVTMLQTRCHAVPAHLSLGTLRWPLALTSHITIPAGWFKMWPCASICAMGHVSLWSNS